MNTRTRAPHEHCGDRQCDHASHLLREELLVARKQLASYGETLIAIQRAMLPRRLPDVPGLDLAVHSLQVERAGGDFCDVRPVGPGYWALIICDVSGHGLASAAILALVHALGSSLLGDRGVLLPGAALALINKPLAGCYLANIGEFVTAFVGLYDAQARVLTYASAGHPPPRLVRGSKVHRLNPTSGLPLGIDETTVYENKSLQLQTGDALVLFTDGITESTSATGELLGDERLDAILQGSTTTAAAMLHQVVTSVRTFREGRPAGDDETCVIAILKPFEATTQDESEVVKC